MSVYSVKLTSYLGYLEANAEVLLNSLIRWASIVLNWQVIQVNHQINYCYLMMILYNIIKTVVLLNSRILFIYFQFWLPQIMIG